MKADADRAINDLRTEYERRLGESPYDPAKVTYVEKAEKLVAIYNQHPDAKIPDPVLYSLLNARAVQEFNGDALVRRPSPRRGHPQGPRSPQRFPRRDGQGWQRMTEAWPSPAQSPTPSLTSTIWARHAPWGLARVQCNSEHSRREAVGELADRLKAEEIPFHEIALPVRRDAGRRCAH